MRILRNKKGVLYVYTVIMLCLFAVGFFYFVMYAGVSAIRSATLEAMAGYDKNDTSPTFYLADLFVNNLWAFFLLIMVIGMLIFVMIYSQHRGREVYFE